MSLYEESDLLYVRVSRARTLILDYLNKKDDFVPLTKVADDLKVNRGLVYFHCKGLKEKGIIALKRATKRSLHAGITEKGKQLKKQINKKMG